MRYVYRLQGKHADKVRHNNKQSNMRCVPVFDTYKHDTPRRNIHGFEQGLRFVERHRHPLIVLVPVLCSSLFPSSQFPPFEKIQKRGNSRGKSSMEAMDDQEWWYMNKEGEKTGVCGERRA